ncbi:hypothetical protein JHK85_010074 [Glycine max]|nr:hypothetical protein JHK85_010074 [Glycine max]KAG5066084.1 hypothetical protein JHK86_009815 [Glycine max]
MGAKNMKPVAKPDTPVGNFNDWIKQKKSVTIAMNEAKGDVYPIEPPDGFTVNHVLDAHWGVLNEQDVNGL